VIELLTRLPDVDAWHATGPTTRGLVLTFLYWLRLVDPHRHGPSFWFQQMDAPRPHRNRIHVDISVPHDQAEARVAAAIAAGGHLVTDQNASAWWVLADAEGNEAFVATWSRDWARSRPHYREFVAYGQGGWPVGDLHIVPCSC
jgi:hypothetical protein